MRRGGWIATGTLGLAIGLVGVGALMTSATPSRDDAPPTHVESDRTPPSGFVKPEGMQSEYQQTVTGFRYDLPEGVRFPGTAPRTADDEDVFHENGVGESYVYFYWQCAWMREALEATGSKDALDTALTQLNLWETTDFYRDHVDDSGAWADAVLDPAFRGDFGLMKEYYQNSCPGLLERSNTPG